MLSLLRCVGEGGPDGRHLIAFTVNEDGDELVDSEVQAFETVRRELFNMRPVLLLQHQCCRAALVDDPRAFADVRWRTEVRLGDHFRQTKIGDLDLLEPKESTRGMIDEVIQAGIVIVKWHDIDLSRFRKQNVLGFESLEDGDRATQDVLTSGFRVHLGICYNPRL